MAKGDALEGGSIQPRFPNLNSSEFFSDGASRFLGWSFLFVFIEFVVLILWAISDVILSKVIIQMLFGRWATFKSWGAGILQLLTSDLLTFSSAPSLGSAGPTHLLVRGEGQPRMRRRMRSRLERVKWNPIIIIRRRLWLFPFSLFFSSCQIAATNIGGWCTDTIFFLDWKMHNGLPVSIHQSNRFILVPDIFSSLPSVLVLWYPSPSTFFSQMMLCQRLQASYILFTNYENSSEMPLEKRRRPIYRKQRDKPHCASQFLNLCFHIAFHKINFETRASPDIL